MKHNTKLSIPKTKIASMCTRINEENYYWKFKNVTKQANLEKYWKIWTKDKIASNQEHTMMLGGKENLPFKLLSLLPLCFFGLFCNFHLLRSHGSWALIPYHHASIAYLDHHLKKTLISSLVYFPWGSTLKWLVYDHTLKLCNFHLVSPMWPL